MVERRWGRGGRGKLLKQGENGSSVNGFPDIGPIRRYGGGMRIKCIKDLGRGNVQESSVGFVSTKDGHLAYLRSARGVRDNEEGHDCLELELTYGTPIARWRRQGDMPITRSFREVDKKSGAGRSKGLENVYEESDIDGGMYCTVRSLLAWDFDSAYIGRGRRVEG